MAVDVIKLNVPFLLGLAAAAAADATAAIATATATANATAMASATAIATATATSAVGADVRKAGGGGCLPPEAPVEPFGGGGWRGHCGFGRAAPYARRLSNERGSRMWAEDLNPRCPRTLVGEGGGVVPSS